MDFSSSLYDAGRIDDREILLWKDLTTHPCRAMNRVLVLVLANLFQLAAGHAINTSDMSVQKVRAHAYDKRNVNASE